MKKGKKVPQRGLGVAQLEKIREEQKQKKNPKSATDSFSSSSIPFTDILHPNSVPFSISLNHVRVSVGRGNRNRPTLCNGDHNLERDNFRRGTDHRGFSDVHLVYQSNLPFSRLPCFLHAPFLPSSSSSSLMNVSTGISSSPVVSFQMEHPSIQKTYGSGNYTPLGPNEEKRPYPFSMNTTPAPYFHLKYPPTYVAPVSRIDESASFSNRRDVASDPEKFLPRQSFCPGLPPEVVKENHVSNVDFLSLGPPAADHLSLVGPPAADQPQISSRYEQVFANSRYQGQGMFDFGWQKSRESNEDCFREPRSSESIQTRFFSFLTTA